MRKSTPPINDLHKPSLKNFSDNWGTKPLSSLLRSTVLSPPHEFSNDNVYSYFVISLNFNQSKDLDPHHCGVAIADAVLKVTLG